MEIYFMFGTNSDGVNMKYSEILEALLSYPNIHFRYFNPLEFSKGTILENFFKLGALEKSFFPLEHTSDVIRVLTLNKYGGQYLDLDVISLTPLSTINRSNFACWQDDLIANSILNLDVDEFGGKMISNKIME
jgi:lactosylceramide 4-alpha-galactosyltransferase